MEIREYEDFMSESKHYPVDRLPITYPILGLNGEAGEAAEKVKKCWRDNDGIFGGQIKKDILKELADVLWYIWAAADDMGYTLEDVFKTSMKKVKERHETNTVHGSGDDREKISTDKKASNPELLGLPSNISINKTKKSILSLNINDCNETFFNLNLRPEQRIHIEFFDNSNNNYLYEGLYKCTSRMDGGLLIEFPDEITLSEITTKLNKIDDNYIFYINGIQYKKITYRIVDYYV